MRSRRVPAKPCAITTHACGWAGTSSGRYSHAAPPTPPESNVTSSRRIDRRQYPSMVDHGPRDAPLVALTFDDGPGDDTPAVLDALAAERAYATFFVHGGALPGREHLVRRAARAGHE